MTSPPPDRHPDARDQLIDRIASGDLTGATWSAWSHHASDEAVAWRTMAESLRDQLLLIDAAVAAAEVADRVELPSPEVVAAAAVDPPPAKAATAAVDAEPVRPRPARDRSSRRPAPAATAAGGATTPHRSLARARGAAGWMVSAMLLLALVSLSPILGLPGLSGVGSRPVTEGPVAATPGGPGAGGDTAAASVIPANLSASDALSLYLERGRDEGLVVEERPDLVVVGSRPAEDGGGYEVLYVRQILERTIVPEVYVPSGRDEDGRPVLTRIARRERPAF
jgi:hypothetical protein